MSSQASSHLHKKNMNMKPSSSDYNVNLKIKSQDGKEMFFKIRHNTKLKKVLSFYCDRRFLDYASSRFLINGELFPHNNTAAELGLEDGAEIDAMVEQMGGGCMLI